MIKKKRGIIEMTNEIMEKLIGQNCMIYCFETGSNVQGRVVKISDNWIEVETKKGTELVNSDFVAKFKVL